MLAHTGGRFPFFATAQHAQPRAFATADEGIKLPDAHRRGREKTDSESTVMNCPLCHAPIAILSGHLARLHPDASADDVRRAQEAERDRERRERSARARGSRTEGVCRFCGERMAPAGLERHLQRTHRRELRDLEEAARVRAVQLGEARHLRSEVHTAYGDWGEIRALILARDVWTCQGYGRQGSLQVHHMSYRSMMTWHSRFDGHEYVAFHRDDLVTLCQRCHFPGHRLPFMRAWPQKRPGHPSPRFLQQLRRATFSQDLRIGLSKSPDERHTE